MNRRKPGLGAMQGGVSQEDPLHSPGLQGEPLELLPRNFTMSFEERIKSRMGLPAWILRRKRLEKLQGELRAALTEAWRQTAPESWPAVARTWDLSDVNAAIESYNEHYPTERDLPMDPRMRDFTDGGKRWRPQRILDEGWILERFPAAGAGGSLR